MRIIILIALAIALIISGCNTSQTGYAPALGKLPPDYDLDQAIEDGCVVFEDGDITHGQEAFDSFASAAGSGKAAAVRLAFYYTLDPSQYDPDYDESIKDQYPALYIEDLSFDGQAYAVNRHEDGKNITEQFKYMMRYEGQAETPDAVYSSYVRYVLTNDNAVTWQDISDGLLSSRYGDYIPHKVVYIDIVY